MRHSRSSSRENRSSVRLLLYTAEREGVPEYQLDLYPARTISRNESRAVPCLSFCLLHCARSTKGDSTALHAVFFHASQYTAKLSRPKIPYSFSDPRAVPANLQPSSGMLRSPIFWGRFVQASPRLSRLGFVLASFPSRRKSFKIEGVILISAVWARANTPSSKAKCF